MMIIKGVLQGFRSLWIKNETKLISICLPYFMVWNVSRKKSHKFNYYILAPLYLSMRILLTHTLWIFFFKFKWYIYVFVRRKYLSYYRCIIFFCIPIQIGTAPPSPPNDVTLRPFPYPYCDAYQTGDVKSGQSFQLQIHLNVIACTMFIACLFCCLSESGMFMHVVISFVFNCLLKEARF